VPEIVPVPLPLSVNDSPSGSQPEVIDNFGAGFPVATTRKLTGCPTVAANDPGETIASWVLTFTLNVCRTGVPIPLDACAWTEKAALGVLEPLKFSCTLPEPQLPPVKPAGSDASEALVRQTVGSGFPVAAMVFEALMPGLKPSVAGVVKAEAAARLKRFACLRCRLVTQCWQTCSSYTR
jgi:hypothetical protein